MWVHSHIGLADLLEPLPSPLPTDVADLAQDWPLLGRIKTYPMRVGKNVDKNNDVVQYISDHKITISKDYSVARPTLPSAYQSCKRFLAPMPYVYEADDYQLAWDFLLQIHLRCCADSRVLTLDEARAVMDMNTSSGLPYVMLGYAKKTQWVNSDVAADLQHGEELLYRNEYWPLIQVIMKNKELLPLDKILIGKFRSVYGVDVKTNTILARFCYDQVARMNSQPFRKTYSYAGKSPYGYGTADRAVHMSVHPEGKVWDLDGAKWEAQFRERDAKAMSYIRWRCLRKQDRTTRNLLILRNLYLRMAMAIMVMPDGYVFLKGTNGYGGNLSGQFCTTPDNTANFFKFLLYGYIRRCRMGHGESVRIEPTLPHAYRVIRALMQGDDLELTTSEPEFWAGTHFGNNVAEFLANVLFNDLGVVLECTSWDGLPLLESVFCAMRFHMMLEPVQHLSFTIDHDRMWSSLRDGGTTHEPPEELLRVASIRNVAWANEDYRYALDELYWRIYNTHHDRWHTDPVWAQAESTYLSDSQLCALFTGQHASAPQPLPFKSTVPRVDIKAPTQLL